MKIIKVAIISFSKKTVENGEPHISRPVDWLPDDKTFNDYLKACSRPYRVKMDRFFDPEKGDFDSILIWQVHNHKKYDCVFGINVHKCCYFTNNKAKPPQSLLLGSSLISQEAMDFFLLRLTENGCKNKGAEKIAVCPESIITDRDFAKFYPPNKDFPVVDPAVEEKLAEFLEENSLFKKKDGGP